MIDFIKNSINNQQNSNFKKPEIAGKKKDIYKDTPVRLLGFANEAGAALSPLIGPVGEMITYAPAVGYIAMDVRDKFKRGDSDNYENTSKKRATKQLIFQCLASVILPTAVVKTAQILADKAIDKMPAVKNKVSTFVSERKSLSNFINIFADKTAGKENLLHKISHGFQKGIDIITIIPMFIKSKSNKSGLRNLGLAAVGFISLGLAVKPVDKFVEKIIDKIVHPVLYKNSNDN